MPKRRNPYRYENRLLALLPKDGSKMQSTQLVKLASKSYVSKEPNGTLKERPGLSPNTVYHYLEELIKRGIVKKLPTDPHHPKEVYYTKCGNIQLIQMSEEMIKERANSLLKELPKELEKTIAKEIAYCRIHAPFEDKDDERGFVNEIINEDELRLTLGRILVKQGNKLIKSTHSPTKG